MPNQYDLAGNITRGVQGIRDAYDRGAQRGQEQFTQRTTGEILAGDPTAYNRLAAVDMRMANAAQAGGDNQALRLEGLLNHFDSLKKTAPPEALQAAWVRDGVPYVRQFANGTEPTNNWAEAEPMLESLRAKISMAKAGQRGATNIPTGFAEIDMKLRAAGLQPGTPEYENGMKVATGLQGRAATGGFGFQLVKGPDGRERMARTNPRTGAFELYDETTGDFTPIGGAGQLNGGGQTGAPNATVNGAPAFVGNDLPPNVRAAVQSGAFENADNVALPPVDVSPQSARGGNPALAVGRSPEEQAALTTQAQEAAKTAALAEQERIKREAATQQAIDIEQGKTTVERSNIAKTKSPQIANVNRGLSRIQTAMQELEGGMVGTGPLTGAALLATPTGQELDRAVGAIKNDMLALTRVPGVGSQSDLEQRIADLKWPSLYNYAEVNQRNWQQIQDFMRDLESAVNSSAGGAQGGGTNPARTIVRTGTLNGRKVVQYSDGTTGYAD